MKFCDIQNPRCLDLSKEHATNLSTGNIKGEESIHLCPDGLVFDVKSERCDYPAKVDCTGRPLLRKSKFESKSYIRS